MHQADEGNYLGVRQRVNFKSPTDAIAAGIGMVHQHFMLADNLTVVENIILGAEPAEHGIVKFGAAKRRLTELERSIGAHVNLDALVATLGVGQRQRVEILKVLYRGAKILILDEPTAVLVPQEVNELFATLRQLVADGSTIIFISHKLDEVLAISDEITVIRNGTTVATVEPDKVNRRQLAELMVGSQLPDPSGRSTTVGTEEVLTVNNLDVNADGDRQSWWSTARRSLFSAEVLGLRASRATAVRTVRAIRLAIDGAPSAQRSDHALSAGAPGLGIRTFRRPPPRAAAQAPLGEHHTNKRPRSPRGLLVDSGRTPRLRAREVQRPHTRRRGS